jgi:hypothetical protein
MKKFIFALLAVVSLMTGTSPTSLCRTVEASSSLGPTWGVNLAGLAMGGRAAGEEYARHGVYGTDYRKNTSAEIMYLNDKGFDYHRVQFNWYRVQHTLYGDLDATDLGYLNDVVTMITDLGMHCSIVPFDYGYYFDDSADTLYALGTADCPYEAFADFWTRMATEFTGKVWAYDLMNEPRLQKDYPGNWYAAAQAAIAAIRAVDAITPIIVPGDGFSSTSGWYGSGNDNLKNLVDPSNNLIFEGHQYFDGDTTGTYTTGDNFINAGTGEVAYTGEPEDRAQPLLAPFVAWCRANNKIGLIGEIGTPGTDFWLSVLEPALDYLVRSDDVIRFVQVQSGWTYPWKDHYCMSVFPYSDPLYHNNIDGDEHEQTLLLAEYVGLAYTGVTPTYVDAFTSSGNWTCPAGVTSVAVLVVAGGGSGGYNAGGGGGAGGVIYESDHAVTPGQDYSIVVGDGGAGVSSRGAGNDGGNSTFDNLTAVGGGGGGGYDYTSEIPSNGRSGGSGGGGGGWNAGYGGAGAEGQGHGGAKASYLSAGGGGKGGEGLCKVTRDQCFSLGGEGLDYSDVFGAGYGEDGFFGGGGGGCATASASADGGMGGGGNGSIGDASPATSGMANTGGGGGGSRGSSTGVSGAGGSGIVLIGHGFPPVLNAIGNKDIKEGTMLSFTISASDADGDALTYSASNLPVGATFDPGTCTFSWMPRYSQAGVYASVRFQVSDGRMSDYEDITVTVRDVISTRVVAAMAAVPFLVVAGLLAWWALSRRARQRHRAAN